MMRFDRNHPYWYRVEFLRHVIKVKGRRRDSIALTELSQEIVEFNEFHDEMHAHIRRYARRTAC